MHAQPYAPPAAIAAVPVAEVRLAARSKRLAAAAIDSGLALVGPALCLYGTSGIQLEDNPVVALYGMGMTAGLFLLAAVNAVLLSLRGQTIGKLLLGLRIVLLDGSHAGFGSAVMVRGMMSTVLDIIPGFAIVDALFIFRADRRCVHDLMAGTQVIDTRAR